MRVLQEVTHTAPLGKERRVIKIPDVLRFAGLHGVYPDPA
jgi:hypothetical protein